MNTITKIILTFIIMGGIIGFLMIPEYIVLKAAANKATMDYGNTKDGFSFEEIDKDSILNSYNLDNIK